MPTFLHISDLHRTSGPRPDNDELLAAIFSDANRWEQEGIPRPDLIVVSGDLVQGAPIDRPNSDSEITSQYVEAADFLQRLTDALVGSDKSKVIVVPGNHDVHWGRARQAMQQIEDYPDNISTAAFEANSSTRWNWKEGKAYKIYDSSLYESRFEHFRQFQTNFYAGLNPNPLSHGRDTVYVEYPTLGLVVVGFASWYGNDCFCHVGEIDRRALSLSQQLLKESQAPTAISVWHHGVTGGPRSNDYMDVRVVHRLIDFGFSLGLHGHHHYAGAAPYELRLPNLTSMAVVGAGSLAVGDRELPMGERRQFNIIVVDPDNESVTIHVRAMSPAGVFTKSYRDDFGGNASITLPLPHSPARPKGPSITRKLDEAMEAATLGQYERALELLPADCTDYAHVKRPIKIKALEGLDRIDELLNFLDPPQNQDEAVKIISLLVDNDRFDEASERLQTMSTLIGQPLYGELGGTIEARRTFA